ncbi:MAG: S-adenosylmethionine:tRNA ribosyltransferase-isomerase, partial [Firmicutes bacterium]|nr:S-adenosylmethionine:tRNA ribosyltransferase-isomerase [Bacillota bacterium]
MKKSDFYFELPQELIAQTPLKDRSSSRLLVLDKKSGEVEHKVFRDIADMLNAGDCLVLNETRVIPARLIGSREDTGTRVEILLLKRLTDEKRWECIVYPGKKARVGKHIVFGDGLLKAEVV